MTVSIHATVARRLPATWVMAVVIAFVVSACGWMGPYSGNSDTERLQQQAQAALTRWDDAVAAAGKDGGVVLVGELTGEVGVWEESVGDNNKRALMAGLIEPAVSLPTQDAGDGTVTWPDGATASVPVVSAEQALAWIRSDAGAGAGDCSDCAPLQVTDARLTSGTAMTSRGSATVPIWVFSLRGTAVAVTRVAIADPVTVSLAPSSGAGESTGGISIEGATATPDGQTLTVRFVGAPGTGDRPCGADYTAQAVESSLAVAVIVTEHSTPTLGACAGVGAIRTATVTLAAPLGARTVLEVSQGRPVAVETAP